MVEYGDIGNYISVSTGIAGSYPAHYPTGTIIYLYATNYGGNTSAKDKFKQMANNQSYVTKMGKRARELTLKKCIIVDDDGYATDNTTSFNLKRALLDSWMGMSTSPIYIIITPLCDNPGFVQPNTNRTVNLSPSIKGKSTPIDYLKCGISRMPWRPIGAHYEIDLTFKETTLF